MDRFPLTRAAALERLEQFAPRAGAVYGARRNLVDPQGDHGNVSRLSAALRRRLIGEDEVVRAVLAAHRLDKCEKFIAEVFWRTYWKGWLEQRPGVWKGYLADLDDFRPDTAVAEAMAGRTGIDAFDHWARELAETGYLHNWARMQVASIWIFTLGLPWQLGAQWFFDRLIDADPASNTLSWRWVAGLHTAGKTYLADADRIAAMTGGRFRPEVWPHARSCPMLSAIPRARPCARLFRSTPRCQRWSSLRPRTARWKPCCPRLTCAPSSWPRTSPGTPGTAPRWRTLLRAPRHIGNAIGTLAMWRRSPCATNAGRS